MKLYIKPAEPGLKVHMDGRPNEYLPADGAPVERSNYWVRRLKDGSVIETKKPRTANKEDG